MTSDSMTAGGGGATALARYNVKTYQPDGAFGLPGVMMLVGALAIVGAVLGFVSFQISQFFYLILLFPILIGGALGFVGAKMVKAGRVRNPLIGGMAGFLGGVFAMTAMHYFSYEAFKKEVATSLPPEFRAYAESIPKGQQVPAEQGMSTEERDELQLAVDAVHVQSFGDYMQLEATQGVELKKAGTSGKGLNLGYYGTWIYWLVELFIVAGITYAWVRKGTMEPFCASCDQWKRPAVLGFLTTEPGAAAEAVASGDLSRIRMVNPTDQVTPVRVTACACDGCVGKGDVDVRVDHLTADKEGKTTENAVAHVTYPAEALPRLMGLFKGPQPVSEALATPPGAA